MPEYKENVSLGRGLRFAVVVSRYNGFIAGQIA